MTNALLKSALEGSLRIMSENPDSPLAEATADSVDYLLDQINEHLVAGMPEKITDDKLLQAIELYRAQALRWTQEEQVKSNKRRDKKDKTSGPNQAVEIDLGDLLDGEGP